MCLHSTLPVPPFEDRLDEEECPVYRPNTDNRELVHRGLASRRRCPPRRCARRTGAGADDVPLAGASGWSSHATGPGTVCGHSLRGFLRPGSQLDRQFALHTRLLANGSPGIGPQRQIKAMIEERLTIARNGEVDVASCLTAQFGHASIGIEDDACHPQRSLALHSG